MVRLIRDRHNFLYLTGSPRLFRRVYIEHLSDANMLTMERSGISGSVFYSS